MLITPVLYFLRDFYTLAELQKIPPPQGVDPAKLEVYLSDNDFKVSGACKTNLMKCHCNYTFKPVTVCASCKIWPKLFEFVFSNP